MKFRDREPTQRADGTVTEWHSTGLGSKDGIQDGEMGCSRCMDGWHGRRQHSGQTTGHAFCRMPWHRTIEVPSVLAFTPSSFKLGAVSPHCDVLRGGALCRI